MQIASRGKVDACSKRKTCFSLVTFDFSFACVVSIEVVNSKFWTPPVPLKKKRINRFSKGYEIEQKNYWKGLATSCSESRRKYDTRGKSIVQSAQKKYLESMFLGDLEVTETSGKKSIFSTTMNLSYQLILTIS